MPVGIVEGGGGSREVCPDAFFARPDSALEEELLEWFEEACVMERYAVSEEVDCDGITVSDVVPEVREFECGDVEAFAHAGCGLFGDDAVALDDFGAEYLGEVIYDNQYVDVSLAVKRLFFAGDAAEEDGCFEECVEFFPQLRDEFLGEFVV